MKLKIIIATLTVAVAAVLLGMFVPSADARRYQQPVIVEGDSLAWQMQAAMEARSPIRWYDAVPGRQTEEGVTRLLTRTDLERYPVLVSLGTNDVLRADAYSHVAHQARLLLREADCVVWGLVKRTDSAIGIAGMERVNAGLRSVKRLHLVPGVTPHAGDGVHLSEADTRERARRFLEVAHDSC